MNSDLAKIKKYYGENMAHLARELFPSILEQEGLLFSLIDSKFNHSKFLYDDIITNNLKYNFKNFIYNLIDDNPYEVITDKKPDELMDEAGYNLYECKTLSDIQKFRKYFKPKEELCTFNDPNRLETDYVFFAVKKNVDEIKEEDFLVPSRQDEYGTSVISIQFSKEEINHLSIKNRYNHSVSNPDATFSNNLENIIPGLTYSFAHTYNLNIYSNKYKFELQNYYQANDGKFYKYNMEINNIYFCPDNIIIDHGKVITDYKDKSRYIFMDYFIIDMKEKNIFCYDKRMDDSFLEYYNRFNKVEIKKTKNGRNLKLYLDNKIVKISVDKQSCITSFEDEKIEEIGDSFLAYNTSMESINLSNVKKIGAYFLYDNTCMKKMNLEKVERIGNDFLYSNNSLINLRLPSIQKIGNDFLYKNERLSYLDISTIKEIGSSVLWNNRYLKVLYLPNVIKIGDKFLFNNTFLENIYAPLLEEVGDYFLNNNKTLIYASFERLKYIGKYFLRANNSIEKVNLPNVISIDSSFLEDNEVLNSIYVPKLEKIGRNFLFQNKELEELYLFNTTLIESDFIFNNKKLKKFIAPNLQKVGNEFLCWNESLIYLYLDSLVEVGRKFMNGNECLEEFIAPNLLIIGDRTLQFNKSLKYIEVSNNFEYYEELFLDNHDKKEEIKENIMAGGIWDAKGYSLCKR